MAEHFHALRVAEIVPETNDANSVRFEIPPDLQDWMVTVKRIGGGLFSNWVGDQLKAGDTVEVMPPHGSFTTEFDAAKSRHLVGIAGGSGITPVMSLIRTLLREEPRSSFTLM